MDVRGGEPGDAAAKVALQVPVWAVRVHGLLEGMDLTHNLCYAPTTSDGAMRMSTTGNGETQQSNSDTIIRIPRWCFFLVSSILSFACDLV